MVVTTHPGIMFAPSQGMSLKLSTPTHTTKEGAMAWGMIVSSASLFGMLFLALYADQIEESIVVDEGGRGTGPSDPPQQSQGSQTESPAPVKRAA